MKKYLLFLFSIFLTVASAQTEITNTRIIQPTTTVGYFSQSYTRHLNSAKDEMFLTTLSKGVSEYFGNTNGAEDRQYISRIGADGLPKWNSAVYNATKLALPNSSQDFASVDNNDNFYVLAKPQNDEARFTDAFGTTVNFNFGYQKLIKIDKNGKLMWYKDFRAYAAGVKTDNNGDVYLYGDNLSLNNQANGFFSIIKIDGLTGNVIYNKNDFNSSLWQIVPVFDNSNNLYVFIEPLAVLSDSIFTTESITIPLNKDGFNSLLIKFDSAGNPVFGKNFYPVNSVSSSYSWINDAKFDGTDIIVGGNLANTIVNSMFTGISGSQISNAYSSNYAGFIAKIDLNGNVKWEKDIQSSQDLLTGMYTNIDLDEQHNIYAYLSLKDKIRINNNEYFFGNSPLESKVITKLNSHGVLSYFKDVDHSVNIYQGVLYYNLIDVVGVDKFNILGNTSNNNFLNFQISNSAIPKLYIASFIDANLFSNEKKLSTLEIYPNPTSDILNVQTEQKISKVEIFDTSGKLVKSVSGNDKTINVSNLSKGIYLIKIYADKNIINSKFIRN